MAMKKGELVPYTFEHEKFGKVRAITIKAEPWLVGKDIAAALGYKDTKSALQDHVLNKFKKIINAKTLQQMASESKGDEMHPLETGDWEFDSPRGLTFINEQGMYRLILRSNLPKAEEFTDWVCDVLVSIRKTGSYSLVSKKDAFSQEFADLERERLTLERERLNFEYDRLDFECDRLDFEREQLKLANSEESKTMAKVQLLRELASASKDDFLRYDLVHYAAKLLIGEDSDITKYTRRRITR